MRSFDGLITSFSTFVFHLALTFGAPTCFVTSVVGCAKGELAVAGAYARAYSKSEKSCARGCAFVRMQRRSRHTVEFLSQILTNSLSLVLIEVSEGTVAFDWSEDVALDTFIRIWSFTCEGRRVTSGVTSTPSTSTWFGGAPPPGAASAPDSACWTYTAITEPGFALSCT